MGLSETDLKNWTETLNLEWSATFRYKMQTQILNNPRLVGIIDGIMRNEADHIDISMDYLKDNFQTDIKGFRTVLFFMYMNLEFERLANSLYAKFRGQSENEDIRKSFKYIFYRVICNNYYTN